MKSCLFRITTVSMLMLQHACFNGPALFNQEGDEGEREVGIIGAEDGAVSGMFSATASGTQSLSNEDGTKLSVPPGSLSIDTTITMSEGADLAHSGVFGSLGVSGGSSAGSAAYVGSSEKVDASGAMRLEIPLDGSSLWLALAGDLDRLVVIYRIEFAALGVVKTGIIPRTQISIKGNSAVIETMHFGIFQPVYLTDVAEAQKPIEKVTDAKIIPASEVVLESFVLSAEKNSLTVDDKVQVNTLGKFSDNTERELNNKTKWSSSSSTILSIDSSGLALARAAGSAKITGSYLAKSSSVSFTVAAKASANLPPSVTFNEPAGGNDSVIAGVNFSVSVAITDNDSNPTMTLYRKSGSGGNCQNDPTSFGWTLVQASISKAGAAAYSFATGTFAGQDVYFCAKISDSPNANIYIESPSYLEVSANSAPGISISEPNGSGDTLGQGGSYNIQFSASDSDNNATVKLYYSTSGSGCDAALTGWTAISGAQNLSEDNDTTFAWNTSSLAGASSYYVCASVSDGVNPPTYALSSGAMTVNAAPSISISEPAGANDRASDGATFIIQISGSDPDDAALIDLYYKAGTTSCTDGSLTGWTSIVTSQPETTIYKSWALPLGNQGANFYICARIYDTHTSVYTLSPSYIKVNNPPTFSFTNNTGTGTVGGSDPSFTVTMNEGDSLTLNFSKSDIDGDTTALSCTGAGFVATASTTATLTPSQGDVGSGSFTCKVNDGLENSATKTFNYTVNPVDDPPTIVVAGSNGLKSFTGTGTFGDPYIATVQALESPAPSVQFTITDPEAQATTLECTDPGGFVAFAGTQINFSPQYSDIGTTEIVSCRGRDATQYSLSTIYIKVVATDPKQRIFITDATYTGNITHNGLSGLPAADAICQDRATDWTKPGTYLAVLSDRNYSVKDRLNIYGPILNGSTSTIIANYSAAFFSGNWSNSANKKFDASVHNGNVWTGTEPDGTVRPGLENHCLNWTANSGHYGVSGQTTASTQGFKNLSGTFASCATSQPFYCIYHPGPRPLERFEAVRSASGQIDLQIDYPSDTSEYSQVNIYRSTGTTPPPCGSGTLTYTTSSFNGTTYPDTGLTAANLYSYRVCITDNKNRVTDFQIAKGIRASGPPVYVAYTTNATTGAVPNGGGIAGFDAFCAANNSLSLVNVRAIISSGPGLSSDYGAIIHAKDRMRIDGPVENSANATLANDIDDFWNGSLFSTILAEDQTNGAGSTWTGTTASGTAENTNHCSNWTSNSAVQSARVGSKTSASTATFASGTAMCNQSAHVYCIGEKLTP